MFPVENIAVMIPIVALMIPIVAILSAHQQKMARIIHETRNSGQDVEVQRLRSEVEQLKQLVHQQTIAIDNLSSLPAKQSSQTELQSRL
ncbi:MAG: hypothetical protein K8H99_08740 [Nitrospirae bacterium]|nr:hypothetical protein [Fimbriimonadaceae bacterium]